MAKFCINCGAELKEGADVCVGCGKVINKEETKASAGNKSKVTAGLLALFLGTLGIHNFYLGHTGKAVYYNHWLDNISIYSWNIFNWSSKYLGIYRNDYDIYWWNQRF